MGYPHALPIPVMPVGIRKETFLRGLNESNAALSAAG